MSREYRFLFIAIAIFVFASHGCQGSQKLQGNTDSIQGEEKVVAMDPVVRHEEKGCLACHEGVEVINERMQPYLLAFARKIYGVTVGYECAICHEGDPSSGEKETAHDGFIPNPSSMWPCTKERVALNVMMAREA